MRSTDRMGLAMACACIVATLGAGACGKRVVLGTVVGSSEDAGGVASNTSGTGAFTVDAAIGDAAGEPVEPTTEDDDESDDDHDESGDSSEGHGEESETERAEDDDDASETEEPRDTADADRLEDDAVDDAEDDAVESEQFESSDSN
jgi:hypothetical protein